MTTEHARQYETLREYSDGWGYWGYLWDTLKKCSNEVTDERAIQILEEQMLNITVYVMWDLHTVEKWLGAKPPWIFGKNVVLEGAYQDMLAGQAYLPQDLYTFDEGLDWTLISTHEADATGSYRTYLQSPCE